MVRITEILTGGKTASKKPAGKAEAKPAEEKASAEAKAEKPAAEKPAAATETASEAAVTPLFDTPKGAADDLKKISGVGPVLEKKLNALGITQYAQVAAFSPEDIERVDAELNFKGRIERENWLEQAKTLAAGE